jgi:hypothetical protein
MLYRYLICTLHENGRGSELPTERVQEITREAAKR